MQHILKKIPSTPIGPAKHLGYCPSCGDAACSLLIEQGDGMVFIRCKNGCNAAEILYAVNLNLRDLVQRWSYWLSMTFLGLIAVARADGIKISRADKDQEIKAYATTQRMYKAAVEKQNREREQEAA